MQLNQEQRTFLVSVKNFNKRFNVVQAGAKWITLQHSFWNKSEIDRAAKIQEEWDVPKPLIPFYGDWHTLICLHPIDGTLRLLDDRRRVVFKWPTIKEFVRCLASQPEEPADTSGIIESESWLDI
jgi:hypothetical protein